MCAHVCASVYVCVRVRAHVCVLVSVVVRAVRAACAVVPQACGSLRELVCLHFGVCSV